VYGKKIISHLYNFPVKITQRPAYTCTYNENITYNIIVFMCTETVDLNVVPLVVFGLLQHENKMSVVHFVLRRSGHVSVPVKSKERLVFHCGVRRFSAAPVFSQHTVGDKQKYERFFPREGVCVATVFAPINYPPQPVLVFKPTFDTHQLFALGSLYKVDPNRVVCKRIVLSGHPFKINKKSAVIRYMFFNREDIQWFKPIELRTKHGRRGHIKEPLGTHGHMKCVLDGQLKAQDTILMNLYKRVYPKWTYSEAISLPTHWADGRSQSPPEETSMD
jgi:pre-rRNA-processing protein TSR1